MSDFRVVEVDYLDDLIVQDGKVIATITYKADMTIFDRPHVHVREEVRALIEERPVE